jgi:hypothetical protein
MMKLRVVAVLMAMGSSVIEARAAEQPGAANRSFPPLAPPAAETAAPTPTSTAQTTPVAPAPEAQPPAIQPPAIQPVAAVPPVAPAAPIPTRTGELSSQQPARRQRDWDLGAGIGFGDSSFASLGGTFFDGTPSYRASLERRLIDGTWLGITAFLDYDAGTQPVYSSGSPPAQRERIDYSTSSIGGLLGVRQVVYRDVVELSLYGAFGYQRTRVGGDVLLPGESLRGLSAPGSFAHVWRITAGLTLERELIDGLAVRLSAEFGNLMRSRTVQILDGDSPSSDTKDDRIQLHIAPALDLRFYF